MLTNLRKKSGWEKTIFSLQPLLRRSALLVSRREASPLITERLEAFSQLLTFNIRIFAEPGRKLWKKEPLHSRERC